MSNLENNSVTATTDGSPAAQSTDTSAPKVEKTSASVEATITINSQNLIKTVSGLFFAGIGAAAVLAAFYALASVGQVFVNVMPFVFGAFLFATIVCAFFLFMRVQKDLRVSKNFRVSMPEGYTAVSIFLTMGFFATACMHAFMNDGQALVHWNYGMWTIGTAATLYGIGKFLKSLWRDGARSN